MPPIQAFRSGRIGVGWPVVGLILTASLLTAWTLPAVGCGSSAPEPSCGAQATGNCNNWPYGVRYAPEKVQYDPAKKVIRIQGLYRPTDVLAVCTDPDMARIGHVVPFDPETGFGDSGSLQYRDATPLEWTTEEFDHVAMTLPSSVTLSLSATHDATIVLTSQGWASGQRGQSIVCASIEYRCARVEGDRTILDTCDSIHLLCGSCGDVACGDGLCDRTTEDATNCPMDCAENSGD